MGLDAGRSFAVASVRIMEEPPRQRENACARDRVLDSGLAGLSMIQGQSTASSSAHRSSWHRTDSQPKPPHITRP